MISRTSDTWPQTVPPIRVVDTRYTRRQLERDARLAARARMQERLESRVAAGLFLNDLYIRLSVHRLPVSASPAGAPAWRHQ